MREATRTDWRFLLGIGPEDVVAIEGTAGDPVASALAPWVGTLRRLEHGAVADRASAPPAGSPLADWVFLGTDDTHDTVEGRICAAFQQLKPGGHLAVALENPRGLHWLADWRPAADERRVRAGILRLTLRRFERAVRRAGATEVCSFALLPHHEAPRAIVPLQPPAPAAAQMHALDQVWQRATPIAALTRRLLGVLVQCGLMRQLYPHYLVVARKPC